MDYCMYVRVRVLAHCCLRISPMLRLQGLSTEPAKLGDYNIACTVHHQKMHHLSYSLGLFPPSPSKAESALQRHVLWYVACGSRCL